MKLVLTALLLTGCGAKLQNETVYRVEGEATVRVVVGVDVTACESVPPEDKLECIQAMIELAEMLSAMAQRSDSDGSHTTQ